MQCPKCRKGKTAVKEVVQSNGSYQIGKGKAYLKAWAEGFGHAVYVARTHQCRACAHRFRALEFPMQTQ